MTLLDVIEELEGIVEPETYRAKAEAWVKEHPEVYTLFERFALQLADRRRHFGMKQIAERVRFEVALTLMQTPFF